MFESCQTQKFITQRNDLSLLHFLHIFTGTVPQVILQSYAIIVINGNYYTKVFALAASIASIICGCSNYIYSIGTFNNQNGHWKSLLLKYLWHFSMLLGRIPSILMSAIIFGLWSLVPLGLHWTAMTFWIIIQKTTFCHNKLEETLYNVVMGFVYYFCYINLKEGATRYRLLIFYSLIVTENFGSLTLYYLFSNYEQQKKTWSIVATAFVITGTLIGILSMILYYRYFHYNGPLLWKKSNNELELNNKADIEHGPSNVEVDIKSGNIRTFKDVQKDDKKEREGPSAQNQTSKSDTQNADKKFLLDHWIARAATPTFSSVPIGNDSMDVSNIEFYTVENTPQSTSCTENLELCGSRKRVLNNYKTRQICVPTELALKLSSMDTLESSIDEITCNNINMQKRRGICSSDELRDDLPNMVDIDVVNRNFMKNIKGDLCSEISHDTDGSNKKTSSDSIDMDLDLSFSDINSSDINTFNENIVQKLCLSALKNIKVGNQDADIENIQRIALDILKEMYTKKGKGKCLLNTDSFVSKQRDLDTPTEILSVHDYENICAVNIAREAWGLRSWNGYSDIENWLHDGSVVRDRRRDTLTSGSSEISSCLSQELKNAIISAPPFLKKAPTYSNVFVRFERTNQEDYVNTPIYSSNDDTFLAKPCLVDVMKDSNFLEPIIEELDDLGDKDLPIKKRLNSESSLVATIDEIRKVTVNNSPRNVYNRRTRFCDSPFLSPTDSNLKMALWKEPSKFDSSNIMVSQPEKENSMSVSRGFKFELPKKDRNESNSDDMNYTQMCSFYTRNMKLQPRILENSTKTSMNNKTEQNFQDISNRDIDLLWQIVSENSVPHSSAEDLSSNRITSSLQSLIQKDVCANETSENVTKIINTKKVPRNRPRRKFSILREKFEPRVNMNSDEEILCRHSESTNHHPDVIVNVKNKFETIDKQGPKNYKLETKSLNKTK
ncbi:unnamed protein product [Diatraea saccharalis]|uniref:XK-related protein n=1 Tax=Diatraea saccharalis TaxID=40085 RepID=A0A9P0FZN0_9NEOP|nr:unnamed protein product [Diatraea saccharalis]